MTRDLSPNYLNTNGGGGMITALVSFFTDIEDSSYCHNGC